MKNLSRGFTLPELIVVIAIIALLSSVAFISYGSVRGKRQETKATGDLRRIELALGALMADTGRAPSGGTTKPNGFCIIPSGTNEVALDTDAAGLVGTDGNFPNWKGPYINPMPTDPWGRAYIYDSDYRCRSWTEGCEGIDQAQEKMSVILSRGPNGNYNYGNSSNKDDIVVILCRRP